MDSNVIIAVAQSVVWSLLILGILSIIGVYIYRRPTNKLIVQKKTGRAQDGDVGGLPFYIKTGKQNHQTVYLESLTDLTLTINQINADKSSVQLFNDKKRVSLTDRHVCKIKKIEKAIQKLASDKTGVKRLVGTIEEDFLELDKYQAGAQQDFNLPDNAFLEANSIVQRTYVDYNTIYYLNQNQPLIGSSELSFELATDGTLTKSSVKTEDKTVETLLGVLPTDFLKQSTATVETDAKTDETAEQGEAKSIIAPSTVTYTVTLNTKNLYVRHFFAKPYEEGDIPPIEKIENDTRYWREYITDLIPIKTSEPKSPPKKDND